MTRRLALMLAIAVLLMVNVLADEGGALDSFSGDGAQMAEADDAADQQVEPAQLAVTTTSSNSPWSSSSGSDSGWTEEIGMYGEPETAPAREAARPAAPEPRPASEHAPRIGNRGDVGALDRSRMNIEE